MLEGEDALPDLDLAAAGLRADALDLETSIEALAVKLEGALPQLTQVRRSGSGLLRRSARRVSELRVQIGEWRYELTLADGRLGGVREKIVGGISIKREALDAQAWLDSLTAELRNEAQRSSQARESLRRLLT